MQAVFPTWCMHPIAQATILLLCATGLMHALFLWMRPGSRSRYALLAYLALILLAAWLGSYRASPLGYSTGQLPILRGYMITRLSRDPLRVGTHELVSVGSGSIVGIQPLLLAGPVECAWSSRTGAALDDPQTCSLTYAPASGAEFDFLRLRVTSACGIPPETATLRISVLP